MMEGISFDMHRSHWETRKGNGMHSTHASYPRVPMHIKANPLHHNRSPSKTTLFTCFALQGCIFVIFSAIIRENHTAMQRFWLSFPCLVAFGWLFHKTYATLCAIKRKKVAYGTYSHWKSYIVRITLTLYKVFDANFLDSRVCNKCSLSVPLDSSNSVEKLCDSWVWVRRYETPVVSVPIPLRTQLVRTPTRRKAFLRNYGKQKKCQRTLDTNQNSARVKFL